MTERVRENMSMDLKRTVEALLFASPEPLPLGRLQSVVGDIDKRGLRAVLSELQTDYEEAGHAFQLREMGGGWRILTRSEHSRRIEDLLKSQRRVRLSRAALESLAVVAYRQPCTRFEVEQVRGVGSGSALSTLLEKELVKIMGRAESVGKPLLYGTSEEFLSHIGLNKLEDLPDMSEIESLLATEESEREAQPIVPEERRRRLLEGVDRIGEMIGIDPDSSGSSETADSEEIKSQSLVEALKEGLEEERAALQGIDERTTPLDPAELGLVEILINAPAEKVEVTEEP
jgi:segregation and condensation protein B